MKKLLPWLPLFALCLAFGAERIRWTGSNLTAWVEIHDHDKSVVQFGLRDDGVVVWREVTTQPATVTTNSPSEKPLIGWWGVPMDAWTNIVITNGIYWNFPLRDYLTNNIIPL